MIYLHVSIVKEDENWRYQINRPLIFNASEAEVHEKQMTHETGECEECHD
jgi:hypothetical protein